MAWHKTVFLALVAWPAMALADEARCPGDNGGSKLQSVTVYDGPLSEQASLVPDSIKTVKGKTHSQWGVAYIFKDGRQMFVSCDYGAKAKPIVIKPMRVKTCVFDQSKAAADFVCK